tara:strand:- start:13370 stop:13576 length:207 start_codon:yes stop_codon:yes gene_type:complete
MCLSAPKIPDPPAPPLPPPPPLKKAQLGQNTGVKKRDKSRKVGASALIKKRQPTVAVSSSGTGASMNY